MNFDLHAFKARHAIVAESNDPEEYLHCPEHGRYRMGERLANGVWVHHHRECPDCRVQALQSARLAATPRRYRPAQLALSTASPAQALSARLLAHLGTVDTETAASLNLWLYGPAGTGKTHLGHALCEAFVRQGQRAVLSSLRRVLNDIRAAWKPGSAERSEDVLQRLSEIPLLVIDETDKVTWSENTRQLVFALLDMRYTADRPTVLISNATPEHLKPKMGFPSWDRLRESLVVLATGRKSLRGGDASADGCTTVLPVALYGQCRNAGYSAHDPDPEHQSTFLQELAEPNRPISDVVRSASYPGGSGESDSRMARAG